MYMYPWPWILAILGVLKSPHRVWTCNNAHPETGCQAVAWFYSWSSHFNKGFCLEPLRRVPQTPLVIYELAPGLCRSHFMTLWGKIFIGLLSLSSECFHHDCPDGAWMNRTRMITRLCLASAPFIPPMWPLMIFRAAHYMLPAFPRMSCKSRGKLPFELLQRTQVNTAASHKLNIS